MQASGNRSGAVPEKQSTIYVIVVLLMMTAAIVVAAGKSESMGKNKLLLRLNDSTVIDTILDAITAANIDETILVLGHKPDQIIEFIQPRRGAVKIAINEDYEQGMISSF